MSRYFSLRRAVRRGAFFPRALGLVLIASLAWAIVAPRASATSLPLEGPPIYVDAGDAHDHLDAAGLSGADIDGPLAGAWVAGPTTPGRWGPADPVTGTTTITYSFATGAGYSTSEGAGGLVIPLDSFMPYSESQIEAEIRRALDAWEAVANIKFVEVPDVGEAFNAFSTDSGEIRFGGVALDGVGHTVSLGYFAPENGFSAAGDVHYDTAETWKIGYGGPGYDIFESTAHELGHSLGLNHSPSPASLMFASYSEAIVGPQADDILGMQYLYGPPLVEAPEPASGVLAILALGLGILFFRRK